MRVVRRGWETGGERVGGWWGGWEGGRERIGGWMGEHGRAWKGGGLNRPMCLASPLCLSTSMAAHVSFKGTGESSILPPPASEGS